MNKIVRKIEKLTPVEGAIFYFLLIIWVSMFSMICAGYFVNGELLYFQLLVLLTDCLAIYTVLKDVSDQPDATFIKEGKSIFDFKELKPDQHGDFQGKMKIYTKEKPTIEAKYELIDRASDYQLKINEKSVGHFESEGSLVDLPTLELRVLLVGVLEENLDILVDILNNKNIKEGSNPITNEKERN